MDRLAAMETFVYVVETGSFSAAARRLNVGQPAISKNIAQLEERLGVRLLTRSTRGLSATEAGTLFFERAKKVIEEASEAELAARGAGAGLSGTLRISTTVTFSRLHILPHLGRFLEMHPLLDVDVRLDDRSVNLIEEGVDVALRMGNLSDSGLTARRIARCRRLVLGTPAYFERCGLPESPADLADHEAVIYSLGGGGTSWLFKKGATEQSVIISGRVRVSAAEGVRTTVLSNYGLTLSSEWMFSPELASGEVVSVLEDWTLPDMDLWAIFPTGRMASAKARAFVAYVEQLMGNVAEVDA
ncbi:LysR family transcriptional regulator [Pseudomonas gingeri]|uniref:LysR family transcriptional regulator n=1 Tax=Pseudomonas gingeri TaxID=117681 RepID=UPI0015A1256F|nr:LysR family transcriptional regulator [Pseudomonas gingeri]NWD04353.1 LysR family transcriptional regulator [Pseudomonas gingeri]NWE35298.1 LysR family transcriptional regulator [Pseudomonas gingeri]NWE56004.1 LysR family transcriptional regulator [Pseudomonas gingeri]NWF00364.1 LysR family transcriptional regulator [Pseudomonas gingeri]